MITGTISGKSNPGSTVVVDVVNGSSTSLTTIDGNINIQAVGSEGAYTRIYVYYADNTSAKYNGTLSEKRAISFNATKNTGGGGNVLILPVGGEIPSGTPSNTVVVRRTV
nr:MAG TPA: hypothetical protein [Caudoviricetes sp.]